MIEFQFHKGAIKTSLLSLPVLVLPHFNSIKVQLKRGYFQGNDPSLLFQFHKGAIKT